MSFNAEMFFKTNFNTSGQLPPADDNAQDSTDFLPAGEQVVGDYMTDSQQDLADYLPTTQDVVNEDLQISDDSDEDQDENIPAEGDGFDFDDFDN